MNPHINKTTIAFALLGCSALLNVVLLVNRQPTVKAEAPKPVVQKPVEVVAEAPKPAELPQGEWKVVKANPITPHSKANGFNKPQNEPS